MKTKKKVIVLSCMIALLVVTAVFNFVMTSSDGTTSTASTTYSNYFDEYRAERITSRNEEILQLESVISVAEIGSTEYNEALNQKTEIACLSEKELLCETLIKAYGFEDAVVVIGLETKNVNVITKSSDLTADDAIKIYTIIQEENIASPENVKIIPIS